MAFIAFKAFIAFMTTSFEAEKIEALGTLGTLEILGILEPIYYFLLLTTTYPRKSSWSAKHTNTKKNLFEPLVARERRSWNRTLVP